MSIDRVRNPWAIVVPNGVAAAPLRIDVDELVVVGDIGELVDLVLGDLEPFAGALVVVDVGLEHSNAFARCFAHGTESYDAGSGARNTWGHASGHRRSLRLGRRRDGVG